MKNTVTTALLCGLLLFAACGDQKDANQGKSDTKPQPSTNPAPSDPPAAPETETVVLDVTGMT